VYIEGTFVGELDVGKGTVAISKSGQFVGNLKAGKLISDGKIARKPAEEDYLSSDGKLGLEIQGTVVLGPNSLTEIDCNYVDIEVQRGARLKARFEAIDVPAAAGQAPADVPAQRAPLVAVGSAVGSRPVGEFNGTTGTALPLGPGYSTTAAGQG
jgi:hypothetical protein